MDWTRDTSGYAEQGIDDVISTHSIIGNRAMSSEGTESEECLNNLDDKTAVISAAEFIIKTREQSGYKDMFDITSRLLFEWQSRLHQILESRETITESQRYKVLTTLAFISEELGDYETSHNIYESLCPLSPSQLQDLTIAGDHSHKTRTFIYGLRFLAQTERDIHVAEDIIKMLPWASIDFLGSYRERQISLFDLIKVLNYQQKFKEASWHLLTFQRLFPVNELPTGALDAQKAITMTGEGSFVESRQLFIKSFVLSSLEKGPWHRQTLEILFRLGKALKTWEHFNVPQSTAASDVLTECCKGLYYRFGALHPISVRAYQELKSCVGFRSCPNILRYLGNAVSSRTKKQSIAYEQIHLRTAIDIILLFEHDLQSVMEILETHMKSGLSISKEIEARRMIAWCKFRKGEYESAKQDILALVVQCQSRGEGLQPVLEGTLTVLNLDYATILKESDNVQAQKISEDIIKSFEGFHSGRRDQAKAFHRYMTALGLTHFATALGNIPWISTSTNRLLGRGSQALVDAVTIGSASYARKSIFLSPVKQRRIREAVRNEISIVRKLDHPHIVRIYLTYEEKRMFHIIMRPLADSDLEVFLSQETTPTNEQVQLAWKWLLCLVNTLAFIHSKKIRHKDIKPRNILVAGEKIIFADFGSSHAFMDEGNSSTDGPAYGHTVMYCAPEVVTEGRRSRSADVFSLGCVFVELILWAYGHSVPEFHERRRVKRHGSTTNAYHASLSKVERTFRNSEHLIAPYEAIVKPMIGKEPTTRLSAFQASKALSKYYLERWGTADSFECRKCRLELRVEDEVD